MKSKARRVIGHWFEGRSRDPFYVAEGQVFMFPSDSGDSSHHIVARVQRDTPKNTYVEWVCSCKGWFHNDFDDCRHVRALKAQFIKARAKAYGEV